MTIGRLDELSHRSGTADEATVDATLHCAAHATASRGHHAARSEFCAVVTEDNCCSLDATEQSTIIGHVRMASITYIHLLNSATITPAYMHDTLLMDLHDCPADYQ